MNSSRQQALSNWVVAWGTLMVAFAVPHFVDDFLHHRTDDKRHGPGHRFAAGSAGAETVGWEET